MGRVPGAIALGRSLPGASIADFCTCAALCCLGKHVLSELPRCEVGGVGIAPSPCRGGDGRRRRRRPRITHHLGCMGQTSPPAHISAQASGDTQPEWPSVSACEEHQGENTAAVVVSQVLGQSGLRVPKMMVSGGACILLSHSTLPDA